MQKNSNKYKFVVTNKDTNYYVYKSDPYAFFSELRPNTASIITTETEYTWSDDKWLEKRAKTYYYDNPMNVYELHLASWKTKDGKFITYDELSETLPQYIKDMGYTHVEFILVTRTPIRCFMGLSAN